MSDTLLMPVSWERLLVIQRMIYEANEMAGFLDTLTYGEREEFKQLTDWVHAAIDYYNLVETLNKTRRDLQHIPDPRDVYVSE